jgi:hypothetical protein
LLSVKVVLPGQVEVRDEVAAVLNVHVLVAVVMAAALQMVLLTAVVEEVVLAGIQALVAEEH